MKTITLNDGNRIPAVGFGVFQIPADGSTYTVVKDALEVGYRHIDTAQAYFNEKEVGQAIKDSGIPRDEIFVTSKLWIQDYAYETAKATIDATLEKMGLDYLDLYLLHQPYGKVEEAWKALEEAKSAGKIKSIGVSNFTPNFWNQFVPHFNTIPAVNQVEFNPYFQQKLYVTCLKRTMLKSKLGRHSDNEIKTYLPNQLSQLWLTNMAKMPGKLFCDLKCKKVSLSCQNQPRKFAWHQTKNSLILN